MKLLKNKTAKKKLESLLLIVGVLLLVLIAGFVIADTQSDLQNELNQLETDLSDAGYNWLIDYSSVVDNVLFENFRELNLNTIKEVNIYHKRGKI